MTQPQHAQGAMSSPARPSRSTGQRRALHGSLFGAGTAIVLLVSIVVAGLPSYVFPRIDDTRNVDAVLVLGPSLETRVQKAEEIAAASGGVPIVVSVASEGYLSAAWVPQCANDNVICATPSPFTTAGEAALMNTLSAEYGWSRIAVVTMPAHVTRARYIFERCSTADAAVTDSPYTGSLLDWAYQYAYQTAAFAKAAFTACP